MKKWVFSLLILAGCRSSPLPAEGVVLEKSVVAAAECASAGKPCKTSEECCDGYCETYLVYSLDYETCRPFVENGAECNRDGECRGGRCLDGVCASATCSSRCAADADCCPGYYCDSLRSYG